MTSPKPSDLAASVPVPALATLVYIGPAGQESPTLGPLVAGQRYQIDAALAAYLCEQHPEYWTRPAPLSAPGAGKE